MLSLLVYYNKRQARNLVVQIMDMRLALILKPAA